MPPDLSGFRNIDMVFPATNPCVRKALDTTLTSLAPLQPPPEALGQTQLVLAEVLNNIVEHAYDTAQGGTIHLQCQHDTGTLNFHITDQGKAFPDLQLPDGQCANVDTSMADLPEGGFGWFLILQLTQNLRYQRLNGENQLSFGISLASTD